MHSPSQCCQWCGLYLHRRPHPVTVEVDGYVTWRAVLCVNCRDDLKEHLGRTWATVCAAFGTMEHIRANHYSTQVTAQEMLPSQY